jgi:hypothetical protein
MRWYVLAERGHQRGYLSATALCPVLESSKEPVSELSKMIDSTKVHIQKVAHRENNRLRTGTRVVLVTFSKNEKHNHTLHSLVTCGIRNFWKKD